MLAELNWKKYVFPSRTKPETICWQRAKLEKRTYIRAEPYRKRVGTELNCEQELIYPGRTKPETICRQRAKLEKFIVPGRTKPETLYWHRAKPGTRTYIRLETNRKQQKTAFPGCILASTKLCQQTRPCKYYRIQTNKVRQTPCVHLDPFI